MKYKIPLNLFISLILTVGYLAPVTAVTDTEIEALERQLEQQEAEEKQQSEATKKKKAEAKRKAELEKQRILEEKRLAEQNHVASSDLTNNTLSKKTLIGSIQILCQSVVMNC